MAGPILFVGEALVEFVAAQRGAPLDRPGRFTGPFPSGAPAIAADAAALAGAGVAFVSVVGGDPFGRLVRERLSNDGVDVSAVRVDATATTGTAFVAYDEAGEREFVFHVRDAAPGRARPEDLADLPERASWLHVSGASLALSPALGRAVLAAVDRVTAAGGKISFDPNLRPGSSGIGAPEGIERVVRVADVLLPSRSEADALGLEPQALAREGKVVCVTDGPNGARLYRQGGIEDIEPTSVEREIDPTGAGDTFAGVFLAVYTTTGDVVEAAREASVAGAAHVEAMGPMERSETWRPRSAATGAAS